MELVTILPQMFNTLHNLLSSLPFKLCLINESSKLEKKHDECSHYFCISSKEQVTVATSSYCESGKTLAPSPHLPTPHVTELACNI